MGAESTNKLDSALEELDFDVGLLEALASQLLWRIGCLVDDGPVTVRVGLASSVDHFASLPRLRGVTDAEIELALKRGDLRVEWVGHLPG